MTAPGSPPGAGARLTRTRAGAFHYPPHLGGAHCHLACCPFPLVARLLLTVCRTSARYEVIRAGSVVGSPCRIRSFASYVAASVGNGVDQPFVAQHTHCASRRGPGDLELFDQLTLGWYPRIRLVLARGDAPTKDVRDLPVRRNRSDRVNTVNAPTAT